MKVLFSLVFILLATLTFAVDKTYKAPSGNLVLDASNNVIVNTDLGIGTDPTGSWRVDVTKPAAALDYGIRIGGSSTNSSTPMRGLYIENNTNGGDAQITMSAKNDSAVNKTINISLNPDTDRLEVNKNIYTTGDVTAASANIGDVSNTELQYLNNASSEIQSQLNGKQPNIATSADNRLAKYNGTNNVQGTGITIDDSNNISGVANIAASTFNTNVSSTELGYLDGLSGAIQTQLNGKQPNIATSADNRLTRYNGTDNVQGTGITIDDSNNISGVGTIDTVGSDHVSTTLSTNIPNKNVDYMRYSRVGNMVALDFGFEVNASNSNGAVAYVNSPYSLKAGKYGSCVGETYDGSAVHIGPISVPSNGTAMNFDFPSYRRPLAVVDFGLSGHMNFFHCTALIPRS